MELSSFIEEGQVGLFLFMHESQRNNYRKHPYRKIIHAYIVIK